MSYDGFVSFCASDRAFEKFTGRVEISRLLELWDLCPTDSAEATIGRKVIGGNAETPITFSCRITFSKQSIVIVVEAERSEALSTLKRYRGSIRVDKGYSVKGLWQTMVNRNNTAVVAAQQPVGRYYNNYGTQVCICCASKKTSKTQRLFIGSKCMNLRIRMDNCTSYLGFYLLPVN